MALNDQELPQLQQEVQRLLGRCMLRLQQYERLIKALVAQHRLSASFHDFERAREQRINSTARKTLGSLIGELLGSYVVAGKVDPREETATSSPEALACFTMQFSLRFSNTDFARIEGELREMVDLRNNLVHHFIDQHDIGSSDGCRSAHDALVEAYSLIDRHYAQLREWAEDMEKTRLAVESALKSKVVKDFIINGIASGGTENWLASGVVSALREAFDALAHGGWAPVAAAGKWITERYPGELPAKYGCQSWRQVVHKAPNLELRYFVLDGKRSAYYREQASRTTSH